MDRSNIEKIAKELNFSRIYVKEAWSNEVKISEISSYLPKPILNNSKEVIDIFSSDNFELCKQIWLSPQINWDGTLLGCCCSTYHDLDTNVFETNLKKAIKTKKMKFIRNVLSGKEAPNETIACNWCYFYEIKKEKNTYINPQKLRFN